MHPFPHHYRVQASAAPEGPVALDSDGLPTLSSNPPTAFGGPGDAWSPEDLLVASVADCFVLSFRAIAAASKLEWQALECGAEGVLDRVERATKFTAMTVTARLRIAGGGDADKAMRILEKSEQACLITNSLNCEVHLDARVETD